MWTCNLVVVSNRNSLFIYRVKKNYATAITCLQSRDYSSSAPVRYTPNKYCKVNNPESPLPIKDSEKNEFRYHSDAIQRSIVFNKEKSENHNQMFQNNVSLDDDEQGI